MTALLKYDAARQALAEARTIDEVRDWEDKAAAVREYARRARNREMEIDAAEIRIRAQRRRGELLAEMRASGILVTGPKKLLVDGQRPIGRVTLEELDTTKDESSTAQKLAKIEPDAFERLAARVRSHLEEHPEKHAFDVLRPPPDGPSATMHNRKEPAGSLDYSPTPPWGTRVLAEVVLPALNVRLAGLKILEPACGEGHMAEVLREYAASVTASDIFDYGYGDVADFLAEDAAPAADLIISNPPFNKAAEFALKAIRLARVGVAMFVRWQWIEGVNRFNDLFAPFPPTMVAVFAERIPLHMGRWEPEGDTLTAYCWVIWLEDHAGPTQLFWIPPGQRKALTRPDDARRFTANPVAKRVPQDPDTGELIEGDGHVTDEASGAASEPHGKEKVVVGASAAAPASIKPAGEILLPPILHHGDVPASIEFNVTGEPPIDEVRAGAKRIAAEYAKQTKFQVFIVNGRTYPIDENPGPAAMSVPLSERDAAQPEGGMTAGSGPVSSEGGSHEVTAESIEPLDSGADASGAGRHDLEDNGGSGPVTARPKSVGPESADLEIPEHLLRVELSKRDHNILNGIRLEDCDRDEQEFIGRLRKDPAGATADAVNRLRDLAKAQGLTTEQAL
ncbi:MAG: hypothetical protein A3E78_07445 [Alphaproteobacteria bacterium RIFCSPHIGHO2_12_FULL_63_12]|nr:MAG: hypothetical protein A3E78_07445 [Alphaproteobacteria bacterium RIFCSPHIGHO2_12_FULL_63_12]